MKKGILGILLLSLVLAGCSSNSTAKKESTNESSSTVKTTSSSTRAKASATKIGVWTTQKDTELSSFIKQWEKVMDQTYTQYTGETNLTTANGTVYTRYLAYLALVLQLEEQFPQLQRFFDLTALWFWAVLVSGALLFSLAYHYISFAKFSLWETEHNFIVKNHFFTTDQNTIPKSAIVGLELTSDLNRRLFKLTCITAILANSDTDQDENRSKNFLFPLLPTHELLPTLARYFPRIPRELFELPSYRPKVRYQLGYLLKIGILGASLYFILQFFMSWLSALGVIVTGMLLLSRLLFEPLTTRMAHTPDYFIFTSGLINKRTYILPRKMLASIKTTDYLDIIIGSTLTFTTTDGKTIRLLSTDENIL